jgi:UDP-sugar diphosphatase
VDKAGLDLEQITREEILEECGYDVPLDRIHPVTSYLSAIGISGSRQSIFAAEIDDGMALPVSGIGAFIGDEGMGKSAGLLFSLMWLQERLAANGGQLFPAKS